LLAELDELEAEALGAEMDEMAVGTAFIAAKPQQIAQPAAA